MAKAQAPKRVLIEKSNSTIVIVTSVAAFVVVFCLFASKALIAQEIYRGKVINAQRSALSALKTDASNAQSLTSNYKQFISGATNIIGGQTNGSGPQDGTNAQLVLDALPSAYDFPALTTSLGDLVTAQNLQLKGISGTDQEVAQGNQPATGSPQPVAMPFQISVQGTYQEIENLVSAMEHSIRPFQILQLDLSGSQGSMQADISGESYYQPPKAFVVQQQVVNK